MTIAPTYDTIGRITGKVVSYSGVPVATETVGYATSAGVNTDRLSSYNYGDDTYYYTYDSMNNISSISDGTTYTYDDLGRLAQSTSTIMGTRAYTYDNNGNILTRTAGGTTYSYSYTSGTDRLASYNGELCSYDAIGNPTTYRGKSLTWSHGRQLDKFDTVYFRYNGMGQRIKKDTLEFTYDASGNLVQQSNGMKFIYDHTGVVGMEYVNRTYIYRKNPLGDIIAILDESGTVVVEYSYDAWGNYTVVYEKYSGFGNTNPFKYRGYYHDKETGLYYLQSRYYDPETGRFINCDSVDYLDPESINGLNLYAYCLNNPIMYCDPTGHDSKWLGWLLTGVVLAGLAVLTVLTLGAAAPITGAAATIVVGATVGASIGFGASVISQGGFDSANPWQVLFDTGMGAVTGAIGGSGINMAGSMIAGGVLGFGGSIAGDAIAGADINWGKAIALGVLGVGIGALTGAGASNVKNMTSKINSGKSWASRAFLNLGEEVLNRPSSGLVAQAMYINMSKAINGYIAQSLTSVSVGYLAAYLIGNLL